MAIATYDYGNVSCYVDAGSATSSFLNFFHTKKLQAITKMHSK
jgi:hypothetical protein